MTKKPKLARCQADERQIDRLWIAFNSMRGGEFTRIRIRDLYEMHGLIMHEQDLAQAPVPVAITVGIEVGLQYASMFGVPELRPLTLMAQEYKAEVLGKQVDEVERTPIGFTTEAVKMKSE